MKFLTNILKKNHIKTPTLLQMESTECGAASLGIILEYHKVFVPLQKLRTICGISRDGSSASNIIKAARKFKLKHKAVNTDIDKLNKDVVFPAILFWNFNHFLVLEGYDEEKSIFYVNDPASGRRKVGYKEFDQSFTGIAISFSQDEGFETAGSPPSNYHRFRSLLGASKADLIFITLITLLLVIPGITIPVFSKVFIDEVLVNQFNSLMPVLIGAMVIMFVAQFVLILLQQISLALLGVKLSIVSATNFMAHIVKLPIMFFSQRYLGDIVDRVSLNEKIATSLSRNISTNIINLLTSIIYGAVMLMYDYVLALIVIGIMLVNVLVLRLVREGQNNANQAMFKEKAVLLGFSMNGLRIIETIKASGMGMSFFKKWAGYQAKMLNAEQKLAVYSYILNLTPSFLGSLALVLVLYFGGFSILEGTMSVGTLIAFQSLMNSFMAPISNLVGFAAELQVLKGDIDRTNDALQYKVDRLVNLKDTDKKYHNLSGEIILKDVNFAYAKYSPPILKDFNLTINPGTMLAVVGGSGSGKSTLIKLISRLHYPDSGVINIDDTPLNEIDRFLFSQSISVVNQEVVLFSGSIRNNLTFWNNTIPLKDINHALEDVCLSKLIDQLPNGHDYEIEEGGQNFSGGQRQCLEIARALVTNPSILILDEATSALDSVVELNIIDNIKRRGCTCIIVSHRLSAIRDANNIIVMKGGQIIESGSHNELMQEGSFYQALITKQ